jgi:hypothetical protein
MIDVIRIQVLSVLSCSRTQEAKVAPKLRDDVGIEALEAGVGEGGGHQHAQPHTAQGGPLTTTSLHTHNNQRKETLYTLSVALKHLCMLSCVRILPPLNACSSL